MNTPSEVVALASRLVEIPSVSRDGNVAVSEVLKEVLTGYGFEVERLSYRDENDVLKVSLVARRGSGRGGLGFFSHSDVVPADADAWQPFTPEVKDGKLYGRGSCDMKGPLAATLLAAASVDTAKLKKTRLHRRDRRRRKRLRRRETACRVENVRRARLAQSGRRRRADRVATRLRAQGWLPRRRDRARRGGPHQHRPGCVGQLFDRAVFSRHGRVETNLYDRPAFFKTTSSTRPPTAST